MKYSKIFRILASAIIVSLLVITIGAIPALAAAITLTPTSGPPTTVVTVNGTGFTPAHDIEILFDGSRQYFYYLTTTTLTRSFTIPAGKAAGSYLVEVIDWTLATPAVVASASFTVTSEPVVEAEINLDPRRGTVGTEVAIDGTDFGAREDIFVEYDGDEVDIDSGDIDTNSRGEFTAYIIIPESAAGGHTITVTGLDSLREAEAEFTVKPEITISPTSGTPKSNVTVTGTGFGRRAEVTIYFANASMQIIDADTNGTFETFIVVPPTTSGNYEIEAEDEDTNKATVEFTVEIEARADISMAEGNVGTKTTLSGIGFKANGKISIKYDDVEITTATADGNGAFSTSLEVPASTGGSHTIIVTDGNITKEFTFIMESTPPPIPPPLLPLTGAKVETKEDAHFDWQDVTDDSLPVTYTLQIATDRNFTDDSLMIEKKKLEVTEYDLSEVEWESLLPTEETEEDEITYYWRVRATDGAFNESLWSGSGSFSIPSPGFTLDIGMGLPSWGLYALFGLGAIILGFIGFLLGRRTAYY